MGNSYTHLATCEPSEISTTSGLTYSKSTKATNSFASFNQISTHKMASTRSYVKYPVMRPAVHSDAIGALASIRPGMILSGGRDKIISLNNIDTGECVLKWFGHEKEVTKIAYVNAGGKHHIISGSRDSLIKLWQFNSPKSSKNYSGHQMSVTGITVLNESRFVSGARDASLKLWDITSGDIIQSVQQSRNIVTHIANNPANSLLAQSAEDKQLKIWDSKNLHLVHEFPKKNHILTHCDFSSDGYYCLTSCNGFNGEGCEITMWDIRQQKIIQEYKGHEESVTCAKFLSQHVVSKNIIVSVSADQTVRIWNIDDGNCLWSEMVSAGSDLLACIGFGDGNIVVSGLNATLCHIRLLAKAGRPYLQCISMQTVARCIDRRHS